MTSWRFTPIWPLQILHFTNNFLRTLYLKNFYCFRCIRTSITTLNFYLCKVSVSIKHNSRKSLRNIALRCKSVLITRALMDTCDGSVRSRSTRIEIRYRINWDDKLAINTNVYYTHKFQCTQCMRRYAGMIVRRRFVIE